MCVALDRHTSHKTALQWKEELSDFDNLFKFAFVRNPYERFVSAYYFFVDVGFLEQPDINEFLAGVGDWSEFGKHKSAYLFDPMVTWLCDEDGDLLVNFVGRFENIGKDWETVREKIGGQPLPHIMKGHRTKVPLTKESKKILYDRYCQDFELFNYKK
jgi:hypothetical protein